LPKSLEIKNFAAVVIKLWQGDPDSEHFIGDAANYVFSFIKSGKTYYLRLTPGAQRTKAQIEAELDFIAYLNRAGASVSQPVRSINGRLIEETKVSERLYFASVFEEAEGERFRYDSANPDKEHFRLRGKILGQIHMLSRGYVPSGSFPRFKWNEDRLLTGINRFLPETETVVWREFLKLKEILEHYPQSDENFGLIHGDFGETNYRFLNDKMTVFDFDDCCYHWFLYDVAVSVYPHGWRREGRQLLDWLLEGYAEKMPLAVKLSDVTMFCQWRLIYMFLVYARKWGFENLSDEQKNWFAGKRENIARGYSWPE
jgi:Ser/Thr protein kinase RdoA (MazF antagonist)